MGSIAPSKEPRRFDVDELLSQLTLDEKIDMISGHDPWHTMPIPRLRIPKIRLTDGPNGVRGTKFFNGVPAACLPCGTALASTWDVDLLRQGGRLQGCEAIAKGASVILGPTTNMQRSPLGGRGFESFSEDPVLAGTASAATINGIQSMGVAATLKHFVCNDQEHERQSVDCIVSERALREIYMLPFQIAERDSKPMAYMMSYNKVNGVHASSSRCLIQDILRGEWGFSGLVMSDWFGTYSTVDSIKAGLDLEMPGPSYIRGPLVKHALGCGLLKQTEVDSRVREVLKFVKRLMPLGIPENTPESTINTPETASILRSLTSDSIVLLKNENILPFPKDRTTAVIGPNAAISAYCGGGSASLIPYYAVTPLQGVRNLLKNQTVQYELGAPGWKKLPLLSRCTKRSDGKEGLDVKAYLQPPNKANRESVDAFPVNTSDIFLADYENPKIKSNLFYLDLDATFTPDETAEYEFSLSVAGTGKIFVDGNCIVDNMTQQRPGDSFFGSGTVEETGSIMLEQGREYHVHISFGTLPTRTFTVAGATAFGAGGLRAGAHRKINLSAEIDRAVKLARSVDQVILSVGLNSDWESEGYDRTHMSLPAGTDELIRAVTKANGNVVVVNQSGTPVSMPWRGEVPAVIQAWYGGNETGNAIADIIFGETNPSGKLSLSFPLKNEDNPAFLNFRSERGRTVYGEGPYIGYRFYEKTQREVAFPFGHGLSYTQFEMSALIIQHLKNEDNKDDDEIKLTVDVRNTGDRDGAQVVQVYVSQQTPSIERPPKELKGFTKVFVKSGQTVTATVTLIKRYATSFWDEQAHSWIQEKGKYSIMVGDSSSNASASSCCPFLVAEFEIAETSWWNGL